MDIPSPSMETYRPQFIDDKWLNDAIEEISSQYSQKDTPTDRVSPIAFVRCSRGGKTRALTEMAPLLKKRLGAAVIFVSFNDYSTIATWEKADPIAALCRRIAFEARCDRTAQFNNTFYNANVTADHIKEWLKETDCVLLIDELNALLSGATNSELFAQFLKNTFLINTNRYFAFSSHVVGTTGQLAAYMDSPSNRNVFIRELPLVHNVVGTATVFGWDDLSAREIIFYGHIPALIYEAYLNKTVNKKGYLPFQRRDATITLCETKGLVTNESIVKLLSSFITGDRNSVPLPLHELMNTGEHQLLRWIPFHMMEALKRFSQILLLNAELKKIVETIVSLFHNFVNEPHLSGKAWESLFVIVLLIRLATCSFDPLFLPLSSELDYSLSFNTNLTAAGIPFEKVKDVPTLLKCMRTPHRYPHVAVYYPRSAVFKEYDVVIAVYERLGHRDLYGYSLKEGKTIPKKQSLNDHFTLSVLVRGRPAKRDSKKPRIWTMPSEQQNGSFLGESGRHWTPSAWRELLGDDGRKLSSVKREHSDQDTTKGGQLPYIFC